MDCRDAPEGFRDVVPALESQPYIRHGVLPESFECKGYEKRSSSPDVCRCSLDPHVCKFSNVIKECWDCTQKTNHTWNAPVKVSDGIGFKFLSPHKH